MKNKTQKNKTHQNKKNLILLNLLLLAVLLVFANCGAKGEDPHAGHDHGPGETEHEHGEEEEAASSHQHLHVEADIIKKWGIQYTEPKMQDYVEKISLTGVVKENQKTTFLVNALASGMVTAIKKDVGDMVKRGDTLCVLNSPELLELKTRYVKAFQQYRQSGETYNRAKKLYEIKGIEQRELINRETAYKSDQAEYYSLESAMGTLGLNSKTLGHIKDAVKKDDSNRVKAFLTPHYHILSPGSGKVITRDLALGEHVEINKTLFKVSNTHNMWALLDAMEKDLQFIEKNKAVEVVTDIYPDLQFKGKVLTLMETIDPDLRTVKVRVEIENPEGRLKPEMYIRGHMEKNLRQSLPAIPSSALVKVAGADGVFLIDTDGFLFTPVQVIDVDSDGFAFVKGLGPEDMVIHEGSFYLKAEYEIQRGSADPHAGHSH